LLNRVRVRFARVMHCRAQSTIIDSFVAQRRAMQQHFVAAR
jgi:hypothetical protein